MSMQELKQEIVTAVNHTDDEGLLQEVRNILHRDAGVGEPPFVLSQGMRVSILAGLDDLANGRIVSHEEVMREWESEDAETEK